MFEFEEYEKNRKYVCCDNVECMAESKKAIGVDLGQPDLVWIPKSQIHDDSEVYEKDTGGLLIISEWIANEKGLL